jgi:hypothetical protein
MFTDTRQDFSGQLGAMWCGFMHDSPMWPIHGQYQCRTCGRHYLVQWAGDAFPRERGKAITSPFVRSALLPLIVMLAILAPANVDAAEAPVMASNDQAALAFARYIAGQVQAAPWNIETIEVDASLPKMKSQGRLRAIRRLLPMGKPEYRVIEFEGDKTVRQQVILRYLSAQIQAADLPASSVAITPTNYKFSYKGPVETAGATAYSFAIKPRKKREGLINGELWLDAETGAVVRQSGYLVKNPSIFVKRITVTRETSLSDGLAEELITHLSIDTRLVGRAELIIHEHPYTDSDGGSTPDFQDR